MAIPRRFEFISDTELVTMARMGSLEACDELVSRFRPGVVLVARQTLDSPEAAQDVAQETFLLAFRALPQLHDPAKFAGWLHAIARNHARRVGIALHRRQTADLSALENHSAAQEGKQGDTPLETLLDRERQDAVRGLLADLSPECQTVLHLFYYEQWPASRIAEFLSLPLTTIKWRLRYGRKQLHERMAALLEREPAAEANDTKPETRRIAKPIVEVQEQTRNAARHQAQNPPARNSYEENNAEHKGQHHKEREQNDGGTRSEKRGAPNARPAGKDGRDGRACGTDGQLRERHSELGETLQYDCGAS